MNELRSASLTVTRAPEEPKFIPLTIKCGLLNWTFVITRFGGITLNVTKSVPVNSPELATTARLRRFGGSAVALKLTDWLNPPSDCTPIVNNAAAPGVTVCKGGFIDNRKSLVIPT